MLDEALALVDDLRATGIEARLIGGLAVLAQCRDLSFCLRDHRDIDLVARRRQTRPLLDALDRLGFEENRHVRLASGGQLAQVYRPCRHDERGLPAHVDDRVDVYLDAFRLHHQIELRRRLTLDPYTVSASDVLLAKLQRTWPSRIDLRDVAALLKDLDVGERQAAGVIDAPYLARVAARDWGLHRDITVNLRAVVTALPDMGLEREEERQVRRAVATLEHALQRARKTSRWRARAVVGERWPWYDAVDEGDALRIGLRERPPAGEVAAGAGQA